jgi:hypothetical protein
VSEHRDTSGAIQAQLSALDEELATLSAEHAELAVELRRSK